MNEREIFLEALEMPTPEARAAYLQGACGGNVTLRRKVDELLKEHFSNDSLLAGPAWAASAPTVPGPAPSEAPAPMLGRYKLLEKIGEGGFGEVWMAEQREPVKRRVALKIIKLGMDSRQIVARFEAERQALAMMDHPNIAKIFDAGTTENPHPASGHPLPSDGRGAGGEGSPYVSAGRPYFVMELVRGIKITEYCDQNQLPTQERLRLFIKVCQAIQHAHQKGIIHRDIKPSNILVTLHDGVPVPKVIDFGIAKATQQELTDKTVFTQFQQFIGTPAYISPEQAEMSGLDIDTRADIYSLGVLLYELLVGQTPFDAKEMMQGGLDALVRIIREREPMRPSTAVESQFQLRVESATTREERASLNTQLKLLSTALQGDLDWIVMKCLEKDRTRRYETANGLASDIQRHLNDEAVLARPASGAYRFQKLVRRNKLAFGAVTAIAMVLVFGVIVSSWQAVRATRAERQQSVLRADAEKARTTAQTEARRAEAAALHLKMTLSGADFLQGVSFIAEGNGNNALAYLVRSLSANPANDAASARLTTWLTYDSWMVPTLLLKHRDTVISAQFSPDGKRIVTASWDKTARVWDAQTGQPLTEPMKHGDQVTSAQFSPDGKQIVTASYDTTARVWDAQTDQPLTEPMKHGGQVTSAQFSPDGKRIVTASYDKTARVWDAQTGQPVTEPMKHGQEVQRAQFSPDGKRIVTASWDKTARVWDAQTGQPVTASLNHGSHVYSAQFSPDGKRIVTASLDNTARVWSAQTGQPLTKSIQHGHHVHSAQFSPDGKRIVTASLDYTARVWDAQTGQPLTEPMQHGTAVHSAQFSPDGKRIVTSSSDTTARVWDAQTGQPLSGPMKHGSKVFSAEFSPDGKWIVTSSRDNTAGVWDARTGQPLTEPMKHGSNVVSVEFSPDGKRIVTASADKTARVWDAQTGQPVTAPLNHGSHVYSAQFSPDGKRIVTASADKTARVWDAQTGQPLTEPMKHNNTVTSAQFSPDGKWIVTASSDNTARGWDAQTGEPLTEPMKHGNTVTSAQFSLDGKRIVTASREGTACVWDAQTGQPLMEPMKHGNDNLVNSAQFSPDGKRIVTTSLDGKTRVWDAQTGQPLTEPMKHGDEMRSAQFSRDGKRIVTASSDNTARVWDAQTGQPLTEPMKHGKTVRSARFGPDGKWIVTASKDHTARVWDAQTGQPLTEAMKHGNTVTSAQFSPDGKRIVTASEDHTARVWDVAPTQAKYPDWLLPLSEAVSGQVLNKEGMPEATQLNRIETLNQIREKLNQEPNDDDWVTWGRWLLGDRATRTISPFSKITVPEYIENRIKEKTPQSLDEAEQLAVGNAELLQRISEARTTLEQTK